MHVHLPLPERGAPYDDLFRALFCDLCRTRYGSNPAAYPHSHSVLSARLDAQLVHEFIVVAGAYRGVQVDHVQPGIFSKSLQ